MRSLEELKELAMPALAHEELIAIARTASSNTEAKDLALVFTTEQGLSEQVAMAVRWLRILRASYGKEAFEEFVSGQPSKGDQEMTTGVEGTTERYLEEITKAKMCKILELAVRAQIISGFDPGNIERLLEVTFRRQRTRQCLYCEHCEVMRSFTLMLDAPYLEPGFIQLTILPITPKGFAVAIETVGAKLLYINMHMRVHRVAATIVGQVVNSIEFRAFTGEFIRIRKMGSGEGKRLMLDVYPDQGSEPEISLRELSEHTVNSLP